MANMLSFCSQDTLCLHWLQQPEKPSWMLVLCSSRDHLLQDCFEGVFGADFMGPDAKPDAEAFKKARTSGNVASKFLPLHAGNSTKHLSACIPLYVAHHARLTRFLLCWEV